MIIETKLKCNWFINSPVTPVYFSINVTKQKKVWYIVWPKKQTLFQTGMVEPELGIAYSIYIITVVPIIWCFKLFTMIGSWMPLAGPPFAGRSSCSRPVSFTGRSSLRAGVTFKNLTKFSKIYRKIILLQIGSPYFILLSFRDKFLSEFLIWLLKLRHFLEQLFHNIASITINNW